MATENTFKPEDEWILTIDLPGSNDFAFGYVKQEEATDAALKIMSDGYVIRHLAGEKIVFIPVSQIERLEIAPRKKLDLPAPPRGVRR